MWSGTRRSRTNVQKYEEETRDDAEASAKVLADEMQKLGNRMFESMQEFQVKTSQDSKEVMSGIGEFMKYMLATMKDNQSNTMQEFQNTRQAIEATVQDLHRRVEASLLLQNEFLQANSGHVQEAAASMLDSQHSLSSTHLKRAQEHAEHIGTKSDAIQANMAGVEGQLKQLSAAMEAVHDARWSADVVKHIDTTLINENASLAQQIEYLEEQLQLAKELSRDDIREELHRLFEELQQARGETARTKEQAQQARAHHDNEILHHHEEIGRLYDKLAQYKDLDKQRDREYEEIKQQLAAKDRNIEWQREQTHLANLWLRQDAGSPNHLPPPLRLDQMDAVSCGHHEEIQIEGMFDEESSAQATLDQTQCDIERGHDALDELH